MTRAPARRARHRAGLPTGARSALNGSPSSPTSLTPHRRRKNMGQADSPYLQAWHLFIGEGGQLSTDRAAVRVTVGALRSGRVRLIVPEGLDLAPDVAAK